MRSVILLALFAISTVLISVAYAQEVAKESQQQSQAQEFVRTKRQFFGGPGFYGYPGFGYGGYGGYGGGYYGGFQRHYGGYGGFGRYGGFGYPYGGFGGFYG